MCLPIWNDDIGTVEARMVIYHDFHKFISGEENAKDSQKAKTLYFIGGKAVKHNDKHMISKGKQRMIISDVDLMATSNPYWSNFIWPTCVFPL